MIETGAEIEKFQASEKYRRIQAMPCRLIDLFPEQVPSKSDNRYFETEELFWQDIEPIREKFCRVLLKLYCYQDMQVFTERKAEENPEPARLARWIRRCFDPKKRGQAELMIELLERDGLIALAAGSLYLEVYTEDETLIQLLTQLAQSEGLFFYRAIEG